MVTGQERHGDRPTGSEIVTEIQVGVDGAGTRSVVYMDGRSRFKR